MTERSRSMESAGRSLLALLLILVGLLELMAAGSKVLIGGLRGDIEGWHGTAALLVLIGLCYLALARGVWRDRRWVLPFTGFLTLLIVLFAAWRFNTDAVLDLALALVFMLALLTNFGLLAWTFLLRNESPAANRGGSSTVDPKTLRDHRR